MAGAVTVTASLMLAVYAIVNGNEAGWTSARTLGLLGAAAALLALFIGIEARVRSPLVPLGLFRQRNLATSNVVGRAVVGRHVRLVLPVRPLPAARAGLQPAARSAWPSCPPRSSWPAFSLGLSAKLVMRFGIRRPLAVGLLLAAIGLALFARAPVEGSFAVHVLPSMILLGFGAGISFNPLLLAAMSGVAPSESGLASGVVNTSFMMGGALGLAVLASVADARTESLLASGSGRLAALVGGYHVAFLIGAAFAAAGAALGGLLLRAGAPAHAGDEAVGVAATDY